MNSALAGDAENIPANAKEPKTTKVLNIKKPALDIRHKGHNRNAGVKFSLKGLAD